jgi:hypothetical protein
MSGGSDRHRPKAGLRGITRVGRSKNAKRRIRNTGIRPAEARKGCLDGQGDAVPFSKRQSQPMAVHQIFARGIVTGWRRRPSSIFI